MLLNISCSKLRRCFCRCLFLEIMKLWIVIIFTDFSVINVKKVLKSEIKGINEYSEVIGE